MKDNHPWSANSIARCCKNCVAPKRHAGCHDTCNEYLAEKLVNEEKKKKERKERAKMGRPMGTHEFDMVGYVRKRGRR